MTTRALRSSDWRLATLVLHGVLIIGIPAWLGWQRAWVVLPLLLPAWGLWQGRVYTYAWASLLQVFYAGFLLLAALDGDRVALSLALAAAVEFCAQVLFVRVRVAEARAAVERQDAGPR